MRASPTSQRVRLTNNIVRAPPTAEETLRPSNSALPRLHGANLDSLVIRNPPLGIKSRVVADVRTTDSGDVSGNTDTTFPGAQFFMICWRLKKRVPVAIFFSVRKFDVFG